MSQSFTQLYIHFVLAVKYRHALIDESWKDRLHSCIHHICQQKKHELIEFCGQPDHLHLLVAMRPGQSVASLVQQIKRDSCKWIKAKTTCPYPFGWQDGYGAFTHSPSQVPVVIAYLQRQEEYHRIKNFQYEFRYFLTATAVPCKEQQIFHEPE